MEKAPSVLFSGLGAAHGAPPPSKGALRYGGKKTKGLFSAKRLKEKDDSRQPMELRSMRAEEQQSRDREAFDKRESQRHCGYCTWWQHDSGVGFLRLWDNDDLESAEIYVDQAALPPWQRGLDPGCAVRFRLNRHHGTKFADQLELICPWRYCRHAPRNAEPPPWEAEDTLPIGEPPQEAPLPVAITRVDQTAKTSATVSRPEAVGIPSDSEEATEVEAAISGPAAENESQQMSVDAQQPKGDIHDVPGVAIASVSSSSGDGDICLEQQEHHEQLAADEAAAALERFRDVYREAHALHGVNILPARRGMSAEELHQRVSHAKLEESQWPAWLTDALGVTHGPWCDSWNVAGLWSEDQGALVPWNTHGTWSAVLRTEGGVAERPTAKPPQRVMPKRRRCEDCGELPAEVECGVCEAIFCGACSAAIHAKHKHDVRPLTTTCAPIPDAVELGLSPTGLRLHKALSSLVETLTVLCEAVDDLEFHDDVQECLGICDIGLVIQAAEQYSDGRVLEAAVQAVQGTLRFATSREAKVAETEVEDFLCLVERVKLDQERAGRQAVLESACNSVCLLFKHAKNPLDVREGVVRHDLLSGFIMEAKCCPQDAGLTETVCLLIVKMAPLSDLPSITIDQAGTFLLACLDSHRFSHGVVRNSINALFATGFQGPEPQLLPAILFRSMMTFSSDEQLLTHALKALVGVVSASASYMEDEACVVQGEELTALLGHVSSHAANPSLQEAAFLLVFNLAMRHGVSREMVAFLGVGTQALQRHTAEETLVALVLRLVSMLLEHHDAEEALAEIPTVPLSTVKHDRPPPQDEPVLYIAVPVRERQVPGAVVAVAAAMSRHPESILVQRGGCQALLGLTLGHPNMKEHAYTVGGMHRVFEALSHHSEDSEIHLHGCWCLSSLLASDACLRGLRDKPDGVKHLLRIGRLHLGEPDTALAWVTALSMLPYHLVQAEEVRCLMQHQEWIEALIKQHDDERELQRLKASLLDQGVDSHSFSVEEVTAEETKAMKLALAAQKLSSAAAKVMPNKVKKEPAPASEPDIEAQSVPEPLRSKVVRLRGLIREILARPGVKLALELGRQAAMDHAIHQYATRRQAAMLQALRVQQSQAKAWRRGEAGARVIALRRWLVAWRAGALDARDYGPRLKGFASRWRHQLTVEVFRDWRAIIALRVRLWGFAGRETRERGRVLLAQWRRFSASGKNLVLWTERAYLHKMWMKWCTFAPLSRRRRYLAGFWPRHLYNHRQGVAYQWRKGAWLQAWRDFLAAVRKKATSPCKDSAEDLRDAGQRHNGSRGTPDFERRRG